MKYTTVDVNLVLDTLRKVTDMIEHFSTYSAFHAFEPVNEPLAGTDQGLLKWYYQNVR